MKYVNTIKAIIFKPKEFFSKIGKEKGIKRAFLIYLGYVIIDNLIDFVIRRDYVRVLFEAQSESAIKLFSALTYIIAVLIELLAIFLLAGIGYLFLRALKGKGTFENTFNSEVYSFLPLYIIQIILAIPVSLFGKEIHTAGFFVQNNLAGISPITVTLITVYVLVIIGVFIYCLYWQLYALSITHKISKLRAFVGVFVLPILTVFALIAFIGVLAGYFIRSIF